MKPARQVEIRIELPDGSDVTGLVAMPGGDVRAGLLLGHGSGTDLTHPLLEKVAHGAALGGIVSLRYNFPYAEEGRGGAPDKKPVLIDCCRAAFAWLRELPQLDGTPLVAGGKSLGGRVASMAVADGMEAAGLVLLGYPLHPAGRTEELRVEHLKRIRVPMLFVQGSRDKLCDLELLEKELEGLEASCTLHVVAEGDHSFDVPKKTGRSREDVYGEIVQFVCAFVEGL